MTTPAKGMDPEDVNAELQTHLQALQGVLTIATDGNGMNNEGKKKTVLVGAVDVVAESTNVAAFAYGSDNDPTHSPGQGSALQDWQMELAAKALCTHAASCPGLTTTEVCSSLVDALHALNAARVRTS